MGADMQTAVRWRSLEGHEYHRPGRVLRPGTKPAPMRIPMCWGGEYCVFGLRSEFKVRGNFWKRRPVILMVMMIGRKSEEYPAPEISS